MITGNIIGAILKNPETIILRTDDGSEYAAAMTNEEVVLTADADDVRLGETVATQKGVVTGEKFIPRYHTTSAKVAVPDGSEYKITVLRDFDTYDYTKFQAMICDFNTSVSDSMAVHTVSVDDNVYEAKDSVPVSEIVKDHVNKTISFALTNNTGKLQILRFFTYKEI